MVVSRWWGKGFGELLFNWYPVSIWEKKKKFWRGMVVMTCASHISWAEVCLSVTSLRDNSWQCNWQLHWGALDLSRTRELLHGVCFMVGWPLSALCGRFLELAEATWDRIGGLEQSVEHTHPAPWPRAALGSTLWPGRWQEPPPLGA